MGEIRPRFRPSRSGQRRSTIGVRLMMLLLAILFQRYKDLVLSIPRKKSLSISPRYRTCNSDLVRPLFTQVDVHMFESINLLQNGIPVIVRKLSSLFVNHNLLTDRRSCFSNSAPTTLLRMASCRGMGERITDYNSCITD